MAPRLALKCSVIICDRCKAGIRDNFFKCVFKLVMVSCKIVVTQLLFAFFKKSI